VMFNNMIGVALAIVALIKQVLVSVDKENIFNKMRFLLHGPVNGSGQRQAHGTDTSRVYLRAYDPDNGAP
jgi:hypothetical protein